MGSVDQYGICLLSDVNTNNSIIDVNLGTPGVDDILARCKWSTNAGEPILYVKYDKFRLNIFDAEKKVLILKSPFPFFHKEHIYTIDVCPCDGNLVAAGGYEDSNVRGRAENNIRIYDRRQAGLAKTITKVNEGAIRSIRWSLNGELLGLASDAKYAKVVDFTTGKAIFTGLTSNYRKGLPIFSI